MPPLFGCANVLNGSGSMAVAWQLNGPPRKTLGYEMPVER